MHAQGTTVPWPGTLVSITPGIAAPFRPKDIRVTGILDAYVSVVMTQERLHDRHPDHHHLAHRMGRGAAAGARDKEADPDRRLPGQLRRMRAARYRHVR